MEIVTQIKCLEELRAIATDLGRAEAVSALETLLQDCGLQDAAYQMYERLSEWRRPKFYAEQPVPGPSRSVGADVDALPPPLYRRSLTASEPVSPPEELSPGSTPLALPPGRRDPDEG